MSTLKIAIIGSGPSGFYAADALLKSPRGVSVDMFDRLPTPFGLVRGGVAPDHATIKKVINVYDKVANNPNFRFFGHVTLGRDITVDDLGANYDAWIYAVGNERDKKLGIPGEDLAGSHSATEFVGWYNSHPDHAHRAFGLDTERVVVIGVGNVAMDVTRILAANPDELAPTDIASYAVEALRNSGVREIVVLGRRGLAQAAFSPAEVKELGELAHVDLCAMIDECHVDPELCAEDLTDANTKKNVDYVREVATRGPTGKPRKVTLRFLASPVEIIGENGKVSAIRIEKNKLVPNGTGVSAVGSGEFETIPVGLVFRSVGYHGSPIPGVPFDAKRGVIPNAEGRVIESDGHASRQYVVGWAKRGPSGLIGTNRGDSIATVNHLLADFAEVETPERADNIPALLAERKVRFTTFADWKKIDAAELARGQAAGKVREKFSKVADMLAVLDG